MADRHVFADLQVPLRALFDLMSDGVLVTNGSGYRTYSNPALDSMIGGDAREPKGTNSPPKFIPEDQHDRYHRYIEDIAKGKIDDGVLSLDWQIVDEKGSRLPVAIKLLPVRNGNGRNPAAVFWLFLADEEGGSIAPDRRRSELEDSLRRIAAELAGLGLARAPLPEPEAIVAAEAMPALEKLSSREREVVGLLLEGHRVNGIAEILCVSPHTVRNHLKSIFRKVGVHSQSELVGLMRQTEVS